MTVKLCTRHFLLAAAALAGVLVLFDRSRVAVGLGRFDLRVDIDPGVADEAVTISVLPVRDRGAVKAVLANWESCRDDATSFPAKSSFLVPIEFTSRTSESGRRVSYTPRHTQVLVVIHRADGSTRIYRVETPHIDDPHHVAVTAKDEVKKQSGAQGRANLEAAARVIAG